MTSAEARKAAKPGCRTCRGIGLIRTESQRAGRRLRNTRPCSCIPKRCKVCSATLGRQNTGGLCATCNKRELIKSARDKRQIVIRREQRMEAKAREARHAEAERQAVEAARTSLYETGIDATPPRPLSDEAHRVTSRAGAGWLFGGGR